MPAAAKMLRIKIEVTEGKSSRLYLVSKDTARILSNYLESLSATDDEFVSATQVFPVLGDPEKTPGIALRGVRLRLGLTQKAMAEKIDVTQGDLSKMEKGLRPIGKKLALRIGKALRTDYRRFL
jgi:DNA-binding XRE family transcriptional regulator